MDSPYTHLMAFEIFFDGDCPLCKREIALLQRMDRAGKLSFTDIAEPGFDPSSLGRTHAELMARIHGRTSDGALVEGVEVFRQAYAAVGLGPLVALTRVAPIAAVLDVSYRWFAKNRLWITGRGETCANGACAVPDADA